ncbi:MAG: 3D domain-containing protein [Thermodesulfobacteriota bacterium]|jgi:3D (Asp-Asp-Asp) domain-containing protein
MSIIKGAAAYPGASGKRNTKTLSWAPLALLLGIAFFPGCAKKPACLVEQDPATPSCSPDKLFARPKQASKKLEVTAMAYTARSVGKSGKSLPRAANGELLHPDVSAIAVSPDLIEEHGLSLDKTVTISGLGEYKVMDLMGSRHSKSIDIYFGNDNAGARQWGKRTLMISWE